ncbi:glycerol-3-phosphate dehydrogenase/oxidase [Confluentibacter lentus]|uniref:glycerol-3-phosphate dehydrogenase/oxidase n=1 Tax=Confluentibacter lentus TaxID=1699412 RepID=UPI000C289C00|nr:glycerol-3-phosphate dehydrogenase/oxidase [Confluentibacter lentus]
MNTIPFSVLHRTGHLEKIQNSIFDILIIGGGITGAGIALEAASRGLTVCLIEKNDFASGTSNKSTKLIHGGLRYLKQFEIGLVHESGTERAILNTLAPHLVVPEKMLLPLIEGGSYGKTLTSLGLMVYDFLADVNDDDKRKMLDKHKTLKKEPLLDDQFLLGGGYYTEYRTDDARLTIEILKQAAGFGATIINYCEMMSFNYTDSLIDNIECVDHNSKERIIIKANHYVSATGPWVDVIRKKDVSLNNKRLHLTKGVHIVFPYEKLPIKQSIYFDVPDGRMVFAIPRGKTTYVGTTDTNYDGNLDHVVTTMSDVNYLLIAINGVFPTVNLTLDDVESNWAGLRPLIHEDGKDPSELSRKDEIFVSDSGLISIAGGKLTGYRKMAHRVVETVLKTMPKEKKELIKDSFTDTIPLVTPALKSSEDVVNYIDALKKQLLDFGITDTFYSTYLCSTFGKNADILLEKAKSYSFGTPKERLVRAELWYCVHYEMTNTLADFFVRRTSSLYFNIKSISKHLDVVVKDMTQYFNWDADRITAEKAQLQQLVYDATHYYETEF